MKPLWNRKTFWVGVVMALAGVVETFFPGDTFEISASIFFGLFANVKFLGGLALITGRDALRKLEK